MKAPQKGSRLASVGWTIGGFCVLLTGLFYLLAGLYGLAFENRQAIQACDLIGIPTGVSKYAEPKIVIDEKWPLGPHCIWTIRAGQRIDRFAGEGETTADVYGGGTLALGGLAAIVVSVAKRQQLRNRSNRLRIAAEAPPRSNATD